MSRCRQKAGNSGGWTQNISGGAHFPGRTKITKPSFWSDSMQNLLETYNESSNSSHISVESDKQPIVVDVDESSAAEVQSVAKKKALKPFQHKYKYLNSLPQSRNKLRIVLNNHLIRKKLRAIRKGEPVSGLTGKYSRKSRKTQSARRNLEQSKAAPTQKLENERLCAQCFGAVQKNAQS